MTRKKKFASPDLDSFLFLGGEKLGYPEPQRMQSAEPTYDYYDPRFQGLPVRLRSTGRYLSGGEGGVVGCWYRLRGVGIRSSEKSFHFRRDFPELQYIGSRIGKFP